MKDEVKNEVSDAMRCAGCKVNTILDHEFKLMIMEQARIGGHAIREISDLSTDYIMRGGVNIGFRLAVIDLRAVALKLSEICAVFERREEL